MGRDKRFRPASVIKLDKMISSEISDVSSALIFQMTLM